MAFTLLNLLRRTLQCRRDVGFTPSRSASPGVATPSGRAGDGDYGAAVSVPPIPLARARRIALAAQGFDRPRARGRVDVRHFRRVLRTVGLVQLDSVNVVVRAHYLPFFSRLGPYDRSALDRWLWGSGEVFEYWGHEASLIPVEHHRWFRWRMEQGLGWQRVARLEADDPEYIESVYDEIRLRGALEVRDLPEPGERDATSMWGWSKGKAALESLFARGRVTTVARRNFVRRYDLTERVIPSRHLLGDPPTRREAQRELLRLAARSLGVATVDDLADYHRIPIRDARSVIGELLGDGELEQVAVEGWGRPAYLHAEARAPRRVEGAALISPFDSLIWHRPRLERLWGFRYRLEIYVPADRRVHGYYVLPFLLDGDLVARVDLKADREAGLLRVRAAFAEEGHDPVRVAWELCSELERAASWLGLDGVAVEDRGDLAPRLAGLSR